MENKEEDNNKETEENEYNIKEDDDLKIRKLKIFGKEFIRNIFNPFGPRPGRI